MKAIAYKTTGPIDREDALQDITLHKPTAEGRDLLVSMSGNLKGSTRTEGFWAIFELSSAIRALASSKSSAVEAPTFLHCSSNL